MARPTKFNPERARMIVKLIFNTTMCHLQQWQGLDASTGRRGTMRSLVPWGGRRDVLDGRWQGHSHRLEHLATRALGLALQQEPFAVLLHLHHVQPIQVPDHIGPLERVTPLLQPGLQLLTQDQRQELAEDMTSDRLVTPVVDRPGL